MTKAGFLLIHDDEGVFHVGGRLGAARGPEAFLKVFRSFKGFEEVQKSVLKTIHVTPSPQGIQKTHEDARQKMVELLNLNLGTVVIGGGHDLAYPQIQALAETYGKIGCLNIDAHFDLRKPNPQVTSGSPFYLAIENGFLDPSRLVEFCIQKQSNGKEVCEYAQKKKIRTRWWDELRSGSAVSEFEKELKKLKKSCDKIILSVDLDAFAQAYTPGVSAPQSEGLSAREGIAIVEIAAADPHVISLGVFELNPLFDADSKTARLAATLVWKWLAKRNETGEQTE